MTPKLLSLGLDFVALAVSIAVLLRARATVAAIERARALVALAGGPPSRPVMRLGSKGANVVLWKNQLRRRGYHVSPGDLFDLDTAAATADYQARRGLVSDGIAGPRTQRFMEAE